MSFDGSEGSMRSKIQIVESKFHLFNLDFVEKLKPSNILFQSSSSSVFFNEHFLFVENGQLRFQSYYTGSCMDNRYSLPEKHPQSNLGYVGMTRDGNTITLYVLIVAQAYNIVF